MIVDILPTFFSRFLFFGYKIKAWGRAIQNGSGRDSRKRRRKCQTTGPRDEIYGDGQTRHVGKNEESWRMQGVDKIHAEANSQKGRIGNLRVDGGGLMGVEKIMVLYGG